MRVVILHQELDPDARADELDVLDQVRTVRDALESLGHDAGVLPVPDDLDVAAARLSALTPDAAFNLVESLCGQGRLIHLTPARLDRMQLPYTGSGAEATRRAASKLLTKEALRAAALPTPAWFRVDDLRRGVSIPPGRYVIKSVWEHGSLGIDGDSVIATDRASVLLRAIEERLPDLGGEGFAEAYVPGREFNLALLEGMDGPECLPPAEIRFTGYEPDEPRIVGYRAKWCPDSDEDRRTPRSFDFPAADAALLAHLRELAIATWQTIGLGGYARVDFRVDATPQIVDVNTNPCLSADAGFAAALERAGLTFSAAVEKILDAAFARAPRSVDSPRGWRARTTAPVARDDEDPYQEKIQ